MREKFSVVMERSLLYSFLLVLKPRQTPLQRLKHSAEINNVTLRFDFERRENDVRCCVLLQGVPFGEGVDLVKAKAKAKAVQETLKFLSAHYPGIEILHVFTDVRVAKQLEQEPTAEYIMQELNEFSSTPTMDMLVFEAMSDEEINCIQELTFLQGYQSTKRENGTVAITRTPHYITILQYLRNGATSGRYRICE